MKDSIAITNIRPADSENQVVTVVGGDGRWCKRVCPECPWRQENAGSFPAEAFRHSANTAYDMSQKTFGCHMAGTKKPATCVGFLLSLSAEDNLSVRLGKVKGNYLDIEAVEPGVLWDTYRQMAEANGVPADDPVLAECMPEARRAWMER